nr:LysR family transcriptional regulator [uncultured Undibacterium sp.]
MINTEDLRFFCVLAQQESLAATARILNVSPPSVTQRLQAIEERLQLQLVNRKGKSTKLTDEGSHFYARAKLIVTELEDLESSLVSYKKDIVGRLRILAPFGFGHQFIAPLAAKFQEEHNNLSVNLELSDNPHQLDKEWDILIHIGELRDSSLVKIVLAANQRYLCAAPSYLERHGIPTSIADLPHHHCIALRENAEDVTLWKIQAPNEKKMQSIRFHPKLASNDGRVVKQWALSGYGIMQRSEWDVAEELRDGRLVRILPHHILPSADVVALLSSKEGNRSARTNLFLTALKQVLSPLPWRA